MSNNLLLNYSTFWFGTFYVFSQITRLEHAQIVILQIVAHLALDINSQYTRTLPTRLKSEPQFADTCCLAIDVKWVDSNFNRCDFFPIFCFSIKPTPPSVWSLDCNERFVILGCSNGRIEVWEIEAGAFQVKKYNT